MTCSDANNSTLLVPTIFSFLDSGRCTLQLNNKCLKWRDPLTVVIVMTCEAARFHPLTWFLEQLMYWDERDWLSDLLNRLDICDSPVNQFFVFAGRILPSIHTVTTSLSPRVSRRKWHFSFMLKQCVKFSLFIFQILWINSLFLYDFGNGFW